MKDVSSAHSLVLLYRIGTLDTTHHTIDDQIQSIRDVLESVPLGRSNREQTLGPLKENEGNKVLGGYDCVIWTRDAVAALADAGLINSSGKCAGELSFCSVNVTVMRCDDGSSGSARSVASSARIFLLMKRRFYYDGVTSSGWSERCEDDGWC